MRILVTGGTGFIGSRFAERARAAGHEPVVFGLARNEAETANRERLEKAGIEVHIGDVTDPDAVRAAFRDIDAIVHLLAAQHEMNIPDARFRAVNVEATEMLLELAAENRIRRFVHGSTIGVYGHHQGIADEETPPAPDNIYGRTKLEGERRVLAWAERLPVSVIRISEVYGPGDHRLLKMFRAVAKGRFPVLGDGRNVHHPIYVDDMAEGLMAALTHPAAVGELFVMAGPQAVTTEQMVRAVAEAMGVERAGPHLPLWPFRLAALLLETSLRPLGIQPPLHRRRLDFFTKSFALRTDKAERLLGWHPGVDFFEGARRTAAWYAAHGLLDGVSVSAGKANSGHPPLGEAG